MKNRATRSFEYNAICDVCGFKKKASQLRKRWDGMRVCEDDFELRHPLDFYTTRNDVHLLPWTRHDSEGIDVGPAINPATHTTWNHNAIAGSAIAGDAISGSLT
jgi:hypothetical protein